MWALVFLGQLVGPLTQRLVDGLAQLMLSLRDGRSTQLLSKDHVEGRRQLARDLALVAEQQALEERHIELPPQPVIGLAIGGGAVAGPRQGTGEVGLGLLEVALDLRQAAFRVCDLGREPVLLALEQVERDRIGVVGVQELLAFAFELPEPPSLHHALPFDVLAERRQLVSEIGSQPGNLSLGELNRDVVGGDGCLGGLDTDGTLLAIRALLLPSNADEVGIGPAAPFGVADNQTGAALAAVDAALEVVRVLAVLLAREVLSGEQPLHLMPGLGRR